MVEMNFDHFRLPALSRRTGCRDHPDDALTGVCATCLRERLAIFDPVMRRPKTSTSSRQSMTAGLKIAVARKGRTASTGTVAGLRRTRSFSSRAVRSDCSTSGQIEPKRKSCDVRLRNTLSSLFHLDDENAAVERKVLWGEIELERSSAATVGGAALVHATFECPKEEEIEEEAGKKKKKKKKKGKEEASVTEETVRAWEEEIVVSMEGDRGDECLEEKTMKAHMDLDSRISSAGKKQLSGTGKDSSGGFWLASVFTKRIQKWRRKQSREKAASTTLAPSEITEATRRSCDTEPRFSIDAGRNSWDLPRFSLDEARVFGDGYLLGKAFSGPSLSGFAEAVGRVDSLIPVQEDPVLLPGGSTQTRDYYSDSSASLRRRTSFSGSQKMAREEMATLNINAPSSKVTFSISDDFQGRDANFCDYSLRDDFSGSLGQLSAGSKRPRKPRRWSIWGFIHRRAKEEGQDCRNSVVGPSFSESGQEIHREANGSDLSGLGRRDFRCNRSMSSRSSRSRTSYGDQRNNGLEMNGGFAFLKPDTHKKKKKRDGSLLDRNQSSRYSPSHFDKGLLRFYLTPLRSSRKTGSVGKGKVKITHSFAQGILHHY